MTNPPAHWSTRVDKRLLSKYPNTCLWTELWRHEAGWASGSSPFISSQVVEFHLITGWLSFIVDELSASQARLILSSLVHLLTDVSTFSWSSNLIF